MSKTYRTLTEMELCEQVGISPTTLRRYRKAGVPYTRGATLAECRYDASEVARWMQDQGLTGELGGNNGRKSKDKQAEELRKLSAMADNWEIRNQKLLGVLLPAHAVEQDRVRFALSIRSAMMAIPAAMAGSLVGLEAAEIERRLDDGIRSALERVAASAEADVEEDTGEGIEDDSPAGEDDSEPMG